MEPLNEGAYVYIMDEVVERMYAITMYVCTKYLVLGRIERANESTHNEGTYYIR